MHKIPLKKGVNATANSWPAQALLSACFNSDCVLCGGTLIDLKTILTAAQCVRNSSYRYIAVLGLHDIMDTTKQLPPNFVQLTIPFENIVVVMILFYNYLI